MTPSRPPSEQSRWRVELGRRIGAAYVRDPKVAAVLTAGSASRGDADRDSDVELMVAWAEPPTEAQRRLIVEPLTVDHRLFDFDDDWECWQEDLFIGRSVDDAPSSGVLIEVVGQLASDSWSRRSTTWSRSNCPRSMWTACAPSSAGGARPGTLPRRRRCPEASGAFARRGG
jgi:hypothetical protein